jgi:hypothetical protein
MNEEWK